MARPGVSYTSARSFIEDFLEENGKPPSVAAIIEEVGGSATTISKFKRRWLDETEISLEPSAGPQDLPDGVLRGLHQGARAVWKEMAEALEVQERELEERFAEKNNEAENQIREAQVGEKTANDNADQLAEQLTEVKQQLAHATKDDEQTRRSLLDATNDATKKTARCDALDQQIEALKERHGEAIGNVQEQLVEARSALENERKRAVRREKELKTELMQLEREKSATQQELSATQSKLQEQSQSNATLSAELRASVGALKDKNQQLTKREALHDADLKRKDAVEQKANTLQGALDQANARVSDSARVIAEQKGSLNALEKEARQLEERYRTEAKDKKTQVTQLTAANDDLRESLGRLASENK